MRYTPVRWTPVRCTPVKCIPMRCTPVRCTPMGCTPVRYTMISKGGCDVPPHALVRHTRIVYPSDKLSNCVARYIPGRVGLFYPSIDEPSADSEGWVERLLRKGIEADDVEF